jgi:subtilisin family serine protease
MNVAVVAAAGNENFNNALDSPACVRTAISVGAVRKDGAVAIEYSNSSQHLTLLAPGSDVVSSVLDGKYKSENGTSMATPHISGAIAVLRAAVPNASLSQIVDALRQSGTGVKDPRNDLTKPLVNLDKALAALKAGVPVAALPGDGACPAAADVAAVRAAAARGAQADATTVDKTRRVFGVDSAVVALPDGSLLISPKGTVDAASAPCPAIPAAAAPPAGGRPATVPPARVPPAGSPDRIIIR